MKTLRVILNLLLFAAALLAAVTITVLLGWSWRAMRFMMYMLLPIWIGSQYKWEFSGILALFAGAVAAFYVFITPEAQFGNIKKWEDCCARKPTVQKLDGNKFRIENVRDFRYRTPDDFDIRYFTGVYDADALKSLDLAVSHWDGMDDIAHTMLCFNFSDGKSLALSVEMRCPKGTSRGYYTTFFKQHALIYIWATPEDILNLRSNYRGEAMYLYRTAATPEEVRKLFLMLMKRTDELSGREEFYRTVFGNCTTEWLPYLKATRPTLRWDIRALINGSFDRLLFEQGFLSHRDGEIFESLRARSFVQKTSPQP